MYPNDLGDHLTFPQRHEEVDFSGFECNFSTTPQGE